ncbi:MAG TPA: ABC transporter permease [Actinobacteria bacterium]|jgi:ribose transport system permease protein|nr:ABC transporter permease [Actinomycetota bacterium]
MDENAGRPRGFNIWSLFYGSTASIVIATVALFLISPLLAPGSTSWPAINGMLPFAAVLALVAIGQTLVVQQRGFDLSVPGMMSLAAVLVTALPNNDDSRLWLGVLAAVLVPAAFGLISGITVSWLKATSLIVTLAMNAVLYGFVLWITQGTPYGATEALKSFTLERALGIPNTLAIALVVIVVIAFITKKTTVGWRLTAMGVSPPAAEVLGLRVVRYETLAYAAAGACYGIAGALLAGYVQTPNIFIGDPYLLPSVAAVVLGGTALSGGIASVIASSVAALFLTQLNQIVLAAGWPTSTQFIVQSLVILIVVIIRESVYRLLSARARRRTASMEEARPREEARAPA